MKVLLRHKYFSIFALFGLGFTSGLLAQSYINSAADPAQRVEIKRVDLSGAPNMEVIASTTEYQVGDSIAVHTHHGVEVTYVLQGAAIQMSNQAPKNLPTGATVFNLRDVKHGGFKIIGDSPLKLFTVHIVDKNQALYEPASE